MPNLFIMDFSMLNSLASINILDKEGYTQRETSPLASALMANEFFQKRAVIG